MVTPEVVTAPTTKQDTLQSEVVPDVMLNEQNWGPEDDADLQMAQKRRKKKVPKGTSEYQSAWIFESDDEDGEPLDSFDDVDDMAESEEEEEQEEQDEKESGKAPKSGVSEPAKQPSTTARVDDISGDQSDSEGDSEDMGDEEEEDEDDEDALDIGTEADMVTEEDQQEKDRLRAQLKDDIEFEDEVEVPANTKGKTRFQKYRGLKSFRLSPWDPKENLPYDYGRIFQFQNFNRTAKRIKEERDGIAVGTYIRLDIANVSSTIAAYSRARPLIISGLFKHEHKISVINVTVSRHSAFTGVVKSKDELVVQCGFRRFVTSPIFSQYTHGTDKHKCERFLHPGRTSVATFYGPVTYPTVPVLMFKQYKTAEPEALQAVGSMVDRISGTQHAQEWSAFVGAGSLLSIDPDRLVIRRIILTGHPYKVHKRSAVIRYMFQYVDDIRWFKPVELWTKHGRKGHIREPLGTHGLMKCTFDRQLQNHDTVCMSLYKRQFPKWGHLRTLTDKPLLTPVFTPSAAEATTSTDSTTSSSSGVAAPSLLTAEALAAFNASLQH
eukprot:TRINITY_DN10392_c0_g1_i3.p1 TRINITY_DN10392_c0_g1~~TRINITY_DN10392_c0_g1_i3.p1  ORF type:complete len:551 (-),score=116.76 TRINITY_DN10392_c0_g1_i3:96-1748(-)